MDDEFNVDHFDSKKLLSLAERTYKHEEPCEVHYQKLEEQLSVLDELRLVLKETQDTLDTYKNINEQNKENLNKLKEAYDNQVKETERVYNRGQK